jgi:hypothetical protein
MSGNVKTLAQRFVSCGPLIYLHQFPTASPQWLPQWLLDLPWFFPLMQIITGPSPAP